MYVGPYYYHQPGFFQHKRTDQLLRLPYVDGAIIAPSSVKNSNSTLTRLVDNCHFVGKPILIDSEQHDPDKFGTTGLNSGTNILLDSAVAKEYVYRSLDIQNGFGCSKYVIPNVETKGTSPSWYKLLRSLCQEAQEWAQSTGGKGKSFLLTVSVYANDIANVDRCEELTNQLCFLRKAVDGFYLNIIDIDPFLTDATLLNNFMHLIFRLKWGGFEIALSKAGHWVFLTFPLGLDIFGNDGALAQQQNRAKRLDVPFTKNSGFGKRTSYKVWSPIALNYVKYPDDAQLIYQALDESDLDQLYGAQLGFAPPSNIDPDEFYSSGGYSIESRLNHFCAHAGNQAALFRNKSFSERIDTVHGLITTALEVDRQIGSLTGDRNRGKEKTVWLNVFNRFIDNERADLEDYFDS